MVTGGWGTQRFVGLKTRLQQRCIAPITPKLGESHIIARDARLRKVNQFLFPVVCQRLDGRQRGGLWAAETPEDEEKNDSTTNGTGSRNDDDEDFAEFDSSHSSVQKGLVVVQERDRDQPVVVVQRSDWNNR